MRSQCARTYSALRASAVQPPRIVRADRSQRAVVQRVEDAARPSRRPPGIGVSACLRRHGRPEAARRVTQGIVERARQIELGRAAGQLLPETRFLSEVAQQAVEIRQIAESLTQVVVVKQMRRAVQHHVCRAQNTQAIVACDRPRRRDELGRIRLQARGARQYRVVDVEHRHADVVPQRRQFVHPLPVVLLVVGVVMGRRPAVDEQRGFDLGEPVHRHEDVDIREHAAACRRQLRFEIGGPLEQNDGDVDAGERVADAGDLAPYGLGLRLCDDERRLQMGARRRRNPQQQAPAPPRRRRRATGG